MKKILSILAILITVAATTYGQASRANQKMQRQKFVGSVPVNITTNDTTVNTDTSFVWFGSVLGWNLTVQWTETNVTGTTGGTVIYQGSNDNVNWYTLAADTTQCNACLASATISGLTAAATTTKLAIFRNFQFPYIRARLTTTGTQTSFINGLITEYANYITGL